MKEESGNPAISITKNTATTITKPVIGAHVVQIYQDNSTLVDAVCRFATDQLASSEAVVIVATAAHLEAIQANLTGTGVVLADVVESGQYNFFDAELLLASLMEDGEFDLGKAESEFIKMLERILRGYESLRVYGETVDLLWQHGEKQTAKSLEALWNKLLQKYPLSVLCTYRLDNLDPAVYPHDIECLCATHTHFLPSQDFDLLDNALTKATENVMGVSLTGMMSSIGKFQHPTTSMPAAQASLLYISKTMPITTEFILHQLRKQLSTQQKPG